MTTEEFQKRIADLERERDTWREMAVRLLPYLPPPPAPVLIPQPVTPWPHPYPEPFAPYPPWAPIITWTSDRAELKT